MTFVPWCGRKVGGAGNHNNIIITFVPKMGRTSVLLLVVLMVLGAQSCQPPDCDHPDCGSCGEY